MKRTDAVGAVREVVRDSFLRLIGVAHDQEAGYVADSVARIMESYGAAWDPEEPAMAAKIIIAGRGGDGYALLASVGDDGTTRFLNRAEAEAAADLYNRRDTLADLAALSSDPQFQDRRACAQLVAESITGGGAPPTTVRLYSPGSSWPLYSDCVIDSAHERLLRANGWTTK